MSSNGPYLPTFSKLGITPPSTVDVQAIGREWLEHLASFAQNKDIHGLVHTCLADEPWWRDLFALTWDTRTFQGRAAIESFLYDRIDLQNFAFVTATMQKPLHDVAWIAVTYTFETSVATGSGVARLIFTKDETWRAVVLSTHMEGLKGFPELSGSLRDFNTYHGNWAQERRKEIEFSSGDPEVLIFGAGQGGLEAAARLKHLGVTNLVIDKNERVGDNWRKRYESLTLHDPIWQDHMPYLPFPASWPVFPPAGKFANWLELYVEALELDVWTSCEAINTVLDKCTGKWEVTIKRADGSERVLRVNHVVFAMGYPFKNTTFKGQDEFNGEIVRSVDYSSAKGFKGKKVVVIGASSSAHDICSDCADLGIDVTMYQRSSTTILSVAKGILGMIPAKDWEGHAIEDADRLRHSMPHLFTRFIHQRAVPMLAELDRETLDGLRRVGYQLNNGLYDAGIYANLLERGGGYYLDVGTCQKIIDGQIKMKTGSSVECITPTGVRFEDGSELHADVIVIATGFDDARIPIRKILGEDLGSNLPPIWGLDGEGETRGAWRELEPLRNAWVMIGNLAWSRVFSKFLALQIKAKQEGVFGTRYSASNYPPAGKKDSSNAN